MTKYNKKKTANPRSRANPPLITNTVNTSNIVINMTKSGSICEKRNNLNIYF
jgi:hypothetical protein